MRRILVIFVFAVVFAGCSHAAPVNTDTGSINEMREGIVAKGVGDTYVLQSGSVSVEMHSGNADLAPFVGKSVEVTGQFSGTTLYVDEVRVGVQ